MTNLEPYRPHPTPAGPATVGHVDPAGGVHPPIQRQRGARPQPVAPVPPVPLPAGGFPKVNPIVNAALGLLVVLLVVAVSYYGAVGYSAWVTP